MELLVSRLNIRSVVTYDELLAEEGMGDQSTHLLILPISVTDGPEQDLLRGGSLCLSLSRPHAHCHPVRIFARAARIFIVE